MIEYKQHIKGFHVNRESSKKKKKSGIPNHIILYLKSFHEIHYQGGFATTKSKDCYVRDPPPKPVIKAKLPSL